MIKKTSKAPHPQSPVGNPFLTESTGKASQQARRVVRRWRRVLLISLAVVGAAVVVRGGGDRTLTIISYNVQNLFDGADDGGEYAGFRSQDGSTARRYWQRLDTLAGVLSTIGAGRASVMVFSEAEHAGVVADLTGDLVAGDWVVVSAGTPPFGTQVVVALREPPRQVRVHAASVVRANGGGVTRQWRSRAAVACVIAGAHGRPLHIYAAHWKSQRGGREATELYRALEARLAAYVIERGDSPGLLVGDLNRDLYAPGGELQFSLPDTRFWSEGGFATLWDADSGPGSYWYNGAWQRLDHAYLYLPPGLASGAPWDVSLTAAMPRALLDSAGLPYRYNPRTGSGVSDHLPLVITLARPRPR